MNNNLTIYLDGLGCLKDTCFEDSQELLREGGIVMTEAMFPIV